MTPMIREAVVIEKRLWAPAEGPCAGEGDMRKSVSAGLLFVWMVAIGGGSALAACPSGHVADGDDCDWTGRPTFIGGESTYGAGEFIYSDYVHDDYGANVDTVRGGEMDPPQPVTGIFPNLADPASPWLGATGNNSNTRWRTSGDYGYPPVSPDSQDFEDVADILEFRMATDPDQVHFLVRLGALVNPDDAVVGIGIDTDRDATTGAGSWSRGANVNQQLGYDSFVTIWGSGGEVTDFTVSPPKTTPIQVAANVDGNFLEADVPRPARSANAVWRLYVGSGVWDRANQKWASARVTTTRNDSPGGGDPLWPNVYNLLFRPFEPQSWLRDDTQAQDLAHNDISEDHADVDLGKLDAEATDPPLRVTGLLNPQYPAIPLGDGEGVQAVTSLFGETNYVYKGTTQPYALVLPTDTYTNPHPRTFLYFFHCLNCNHNIWPLGVEDAATRGTTHVYGDPPLGTQHIQKIVDDADMVVAGSMQRGEGGAGDFGWGAEERALRDVQETIIDRDGIDLDPNRHIFGGMSMGGGTTKTMMTLYPDEIVGALVHSLPGTAPPARIENVRNVLYVEIDGDTGLDSTSPVGGRATAEDLDGRGYEHFYMEWLGRAHDFNLVYESWPIVKKLFMGRERDPDPARVTYTMDRDMENPDLGLVHDRAYWMSGLTLAEGADSGTIDATALALAGKLPTKATRLTGIIVDPLGSGPSSGNAAYVDWLAYGEHTEEELMRSIPDWRAQDVTMEPVAFDAPPGAGGNGFTMTLSGFAAETLDAARMGIDTTSEVDAQVSGDQAHRLTLLGPWTGAESVTIDGSPASATFAPGALTIDVPSGGHSLVIS